MNNINTPATKASLLKDAVEFAILAPSGHNTQPWLFKIDGDCLELLADRRRALPVVDPEDRELIMSCGAALFNLRLSIRHAGYAPLVEIVESEDSDALARVSVGGTEPASPREERLFQAISKRHTNRRPFENRAIPDSLLNEWKAGTKSEGAFFTVIDEEMKDAVATLIAEGDRRQASDPHFRRELAAWVHSRRASSQDGIPAAALGASSLAAFVFPIILRTFDWGEGQAAKDQQLAAGSPVLALLGTEQDSPKAWLAAGQALQRVLLTATAEGVSASFLNQPIEVVELRPQLANLLGLSGLPQLLMRFGYGPEVEPTPRRTVDKVLIQSHRPG